MGYVEEKHKKLQRKASLFDCLNQQKAVAAEKTAADCQHLSERKGIWLKQ